MITFEPTINAGAIATIVTLFVTIALAWGKFGGRLNLLEFRITKVDSTLETLSRTLQTIVETDKKMAVMDERQSAVERSIATILEDLAAMKRGEGWIEKRRKSLDGEYP